MRHLHAFVARGAADRRGVAARRSSSSPATGHMTDDRRQEFILLSDVLGLSMLTVRRSTTPPSASATESTVFGPFFVEGSPEIALGGDLARRRQRRAVLGRGPGRGRRRPAGAPARGSRCGRPTTDGFYDVQYEGCAARRAGAGCGRSSGTEDE